MSDVIVMNRVLQVGIDSHGAGGFARSLVSSLNSEFGTQAALLYKLDFSGKLLLWDSYGFSRDITEAFLSPDVFESLPMGEAIRTATTIEVTRQEVLESVSAVSGESLVFDRYAHIPCRSLDIPVGGIALAFTDVVRTRVLSPSLSRVIATVGAARLNQLETGQHEAA